MKKLKYIILLFISLNAFAQNRNFTYDNLGRLTQIQYANGSVVQYSYDANGNRLQHIVSSNTTNIDLAVSSMSVTPTTIGAGGSVAINGVNTNTGNTIAQSQYIKVWRSADTIISGGDVLLDSIVVSSVNALGSFNISNWNITIPSATTAGVYYLILESDANNVIAETNETNNTKYVSITVTTCPTITITETITNATCGIANGGISMALTGGASPYQYSVTNGSTYQIGNAFNSLTASTYICKVKDANGCTGTKGVTVNTTGGNTPVANFTATVSNLTVATTNNSQYATTYSWDFGDGYSTNSATPSHTYLAPGLYNVCLTANNTCGSNQSCQNVYVGGNPNVSNFSKVYYDAEGEIMIRNIVRTHYNDGWIISGDYNKDSVILGSNSIRQWSVIFKVDNAGEIIWKKAVSQDYSNYIWNLQKYGANYCFFVSYNNIGSKIFVVIDDFGSILSSQQTTSNIISTSTFGTNLYIASRIPIGTNYNSTFRIRKSDLFSNNQWQKDVELQVFNNGTSNTSYIYLNPQIKATRDSGVAVIGTVAENTNYANNYLFVIKYDKAGNLLFSKLFDVGTDNYTLTYNEDKNGNILISTYGSISTIKVNGSNGTLISTTDAEVFLNSNSSGNKYYLNKNGRLITTDTNFNFISSKKINSPLVYKTFTQNRSGDGLFYMNAVPSSVNSYWSNSFNALTTLDSNLILGNTCLTDSTFSNSLNTVSVTTSNLMISEISSLEYFNSIGFSFMDVSLLDSNLCYINNCNVFSNYLKSKSTACMGDTIYFTNNSTNATSIIWFVNGVNSGNGAQFQKVFSTAGVYTIKLVAINASCTDTSSFIYTIAPQLSATLNTTNVSCGQNNGSITINNSGGTSPYTYSVNNGINYYNNNVFNDLPASTYSVKVLDNNGCVAKATASISTIGNTNIALTTALFMPNCSATCNGTAIITTTGGNAPYTYLISPAATQTSIDNFSGLCANTVYTVTATDITGCSKTKLISLSSQGSSPNLSISVSPNDTICYGSSVTLTASGASTYSWSGGVTNGISFAPLSTTTYTVTGSDNVSNCTATASQLITVNSCGTCLPDITISTSPFTTALTESQTWIQTSGTVLVPLGANVKFDANATSYVQLNPGFRADYGSKFLAQAYNGCTAGSPQKTDSIGTEHTNQTFDQRNLMLYPNPTSGKITLMHPKEVNEIQVFDMVGKRLLRIQTYDQEKTELDLSDFPNGIYHVRTEGFTTIKVIKQ